MNEWYLRNKKLVLYVMILLLLALASFYLYMLRPLEKEETSQISQLTQLQTAISSYEREIENLEPQVISSEERQQLEERIPVMPNVEQLIAELEQTELETNTLIQNMSFSIVPNELEGEKWRHIFPSDNYPLIEERASELNDVQLSYLELTLNVNGEEEDVFSFVKEVENLNRLVHVEQFTYSVDRDHLPELLYGTLTLRAFYSEDFALFLEELTEFDLDYEFDSSIIKSYLAKARGGEEEAVATDEVEESVNDDQTTISPEQEINENEEDDVTNVPSEPSEPAERRDSDQQNNSTSSTVSPIQLYYQPSIYDPAVKEGEAFFYIVQTGGFNSELYFQSQLKRLSSAGVYPRAVIRENDPNLATLVIHSGIGHTYNSAKDITDYLASLNPYFDSWVMPISLRIGNSELQTAAEEVLSSIGEITTSGLIHSGSEITDAQLTDIVAKANEFQVKAEKAIVKSENEEIVRLQQALDSLQLAINTLEEYKDSGHSEVLWQTHGVMIDFLYSLNGYERYTK